MGKYQSGTYSYDQDYARHELANMIILHEYPLSMVEHRGFRTFVNSLQPLFSHVSRNTIKKDILGIYEVEKSKTQEVLEGNQGRIAITIDLWTASNQKRGYMTITAHFIDDSWTLQSRIISFIYVPCPHTAETLSEALMSCLLDWNIDRKLSTLTVDNCTTNDAMIHMICDKLPSNSLMLGGDLFYMRCCAHIINLIVRVGLSAIETGIKAVRDSVAFWTATPKRVEKFEEAARQLKVPCTKKLALDCVTRWNSTYLMLTTALIYKDVFARLKQRESAYKTLPSDRDWMLAKNMCDKLKLFYSVTEIFSGRKYPTSNLYFPKVCEIRLLLDECLLSNVEEINVMAANKVGKFDKYWMVIHGLLAIATVLDPRFKLKLIEYYFPKIYGNDSQKHIDRVRKMCYDFVNEYQVKYNDGQDTLPMDLQVPSMEDVHEHDIVDPLAAYDLFVSSTSNVDGVKYELDYYLEEPVLPRAASFDILAWWKTNGIKYPVLQHVAKDILAVPISTVASESAFSTGGRHLSPYRNRLNPKTLEALICAQDWLWTTMEGSTSSPLYSTKEETIKADEDPSFVKYDA